MKTFSHNRPVRDATGAVIGSKPSPVRVRTLEGLPLNYGTDKRKRLILTCHLKDVIGLRPERTGRELKITAVDLYAHLIRIAASCRTLEKARVKKAAKSIRLARNRQEYAEKEI